MNTTAQATYMPIGSVKAHHMEESYYDKWDKLRASEQRAYKRARLLATNARAWAAWQKASRKLTDHENAHNTHQTLNTPHHEENQTH